MKFDFNAFLEILPIMGLGMAGIFAVTLVMVASMVLLTKLTKQKPDGKDQ